MHLFLSLLESYTLLLNEMDKKNGTLVESRHNYVLLNIIQLQLRMKFLQKLPCEA